LRRRASTLERGEGEGEGQGCERREEKRTRCAGQVYLCFSPAARREGEGVGGKEGSTTEGKRVERNVQGQA
jgi:hypothetical protein